MHLLSGPVAANLFIYPITNGVNQQNFIGESLTVRNGMPLERSGVKDLKWRHFSFVRLGRDFRRGRQDITTPADRYGWQYNDSLRGRSASNVRCDKGAGTVCDGHNSDILVTHCQIAVFGGGRAIGVSEKSRVKYVGWGVGALSIT